jgi:hypothetical protein
LRSKTLGFALGLAIAAGTAAAHADVTVYTAPPDKVDLRLDLYGFLQPRFQWQESDNRPTVDLHPTPAFLIQRARLGTVGYFGKFARVQFEIDVAHETSDPLDLYLVVTPINEPMVVLGLQAGQFRVPFSRQNLLSSMNLQFADVAYFVASQFIVDRDIGAQIFGDLFRERVRWYVGMFNGNDPAKGVTVNSDPYFLFAGRIELSPLGPVPRFEGDLRSTEDRHRFVFTVDGSAMRNHFDDKHVTRSYVGADTALYWEGASLYSEFFYHVDQPLFKTGPNATTEVRQIGWNVQAGYFPPIRWVKDHVEAVARVEYIDPDIEVKKPTNDSGSRELTGANPTWGYTGYLFGANLFYDYGHRLKLQGNYEIRNENKPCLLGQTGSQCTGAIKNNLFVLQLSGGF